MAAVSALSTLLAACSIDAFTYSIDRYGTAKAVNVNLNCRDTYEVFDRPDAGTLIVVTNPFNELLVACLENGSPDLATRQRQVARIFLDEKTNRPLCRVTGETVITDRHREFTYACPVASEPATARRRSSGRT